MRFAVSCSAGRVAAFSSLGCSLRACLPCDGAVSPSSPFYSTRRAGRCCFDVPAAWVVLIGPSSALVPAWLCFPLLSVSAGLCLRCGVDVRTDGIAGSVCSLAWGCGAVLPIHRPSLTASPHSTVMLFSFPFFLFARPPLACSSRSACLGLFPRPRPGGVLAAAWFAVAGGTVVCLLLIVSCRSLRLRSFAFVLPAARVFLSGLVFPLLAWSGFVACRRDPFRPAPCSLSRAFPTMSLLSVPVSSVGFGRLVAPCPPVLSLAIAWGRVIPSVRFLASPRRCRFSASRRSCVSSSLLGSFRVSPLVSVLLSFRPSPRLACRHAGR